MCAAASRCFPPRSIARLADAVELLGRARRRAILLFSSPIFLFVFLPVLLGLYALAGPRYRNLVLLTASLLFYAWGEAPMSWS